MTQMLELTDNIIVKTIHIFYHKNQNASYKQNILMISKNQMEPNEK